MQCSGHLPSQISFLVLEDRLLGVEASIPLDGDCVCFKQTGCHSKEMSWPCTRPMLPNCWRPGQYSMTAILLPGPPEALHRFLR